MTDKLARAAGNALLWKTINYGAGQAISLARMLILAKILVPDDFGLLAIAAVTVQTMASLTDLGMTPALVQRITLDDSHYNVAWTVNVTRLLVIVGAIILAAPMIAQIFAEPRAIPIIQLLAFRPLLEALTSIKMAELSRNLHYRSLAFIQLPPLILELVVAILLASSWGVWAMVYGALSGAVLYVALSYLLAPHRPRLLFNREITKSLMNYGRWVFLTGVVVAAGGATLQVVISRQLGTTELGLYYLASKLAFLLSELSFKVFGEVTFSLYARLQQDLEQMAKAFRAILSGMMIVFLPAYALLITLAPTLVQDLLGQNWAGTVPVIRVLAVVGIIGLFGDAVVPILNGAGQPYKVTILEGIQSLLILICVWSLASVYGLTGAALAWLPAIIISQLFAAVFIKQIISHPFAGLFGPAMSIVTASLIGALIALGINRLLSGFVGLIVATSLALVITGLLLWSFDLRFKLGFVRDFSQIFPQLNILARLAPLKN